MQPGAILVAFDAQALRYWIPRLVVGPGEEVLGSGERGDVQASERATP